MTKMIDFLLSTHAAEQIRERNLDLPCPKKVKRCYHKRLPEFEIPLEKIKIDTIIHFKINNGSGRPVIYPCKKLTSDKDGGLRFYVLTAFVAEKNELYVSSKLNRNR